MRLYLFLLLTLLLSIATVEATPLETQINGLIQKTLPQASIGILIQDVDTGKTVYSKNSKQLRSLASNTKLFTAAAALLRFSPTTHFDTRLSSDKKNIYLTFEGSPDLKSVDFVSLIQKLATAYPKGIKTDIILDHTRFRPPNYPQGISYDDLGWYYTAPSSAIVIDENAASFECHTSKTIGRLANIQSQKTHPIHLINQVITVAPDEAKHHCNLNIDRLPNNTLKLYGCLAHSETPHMMSFAISDPVLYAEALIRSTLKEAHVMFTGRILEGKTPAHTTLIANFESHSLAALIQHMLQESDNVYADNLTKQLGFIERHSGTYKEGIFTIIKTLQKHTHLDFNQIELQDGVGTRYNLATAEQMVLLMREMYRQKEMRDHLMQALPVSGQSGTLKTWAKNTELEGHVFAKTGSMHDISTLTGYLTRPNKSTLAFSILVDHFNVPIENVRTFQADLLRLVI